MGKRRTAAKTGDKKLYSSRNKDLESSQKKSSIRPDSVDEFHQERDESFLALESNDKNEEPTDDAFETKNHILDLGVSDDSSVDEDDDSDSDQEGEAIARNSSKSQGMPADSAGSDEDESSEEDDDDDDMEDLVEDDPRNWGRKKSAYYSADTGDLEIGQDEDDAFVEEAAAKEVQSSRFGEMDQEDFEISDDEAESAPALPKSAKLATTRDISRLGLKDRRKLLNLQHPEMIPIVSHFSEVSQEFMDSTRVATKVLLENNQTAESVGATKNGRLFLLTKSMIEQSVSLNTALYLLLKSAMAEEDKDEDTQVIDSHPIMLQLKRINATMEKFGDRVTSKTDDVQEQVRNLVKASMLMGSSNDSMEDDEDGAEQVSVEEEMSDDDEAESDSEEVSASAGPINEARPRLDVLDEARFGLRHHEIDLVQKTKRRFKAADLSDFGDDGENGESSRALAVAINAIDQRAARKPKKAQATMQSDYYDDEGGNEMADGLKMMEAELGAESDEHSPGAHAEDSDDGMRRAEEDPDVGMGFYNAMAATAERKRQIKKDMHRVAPKFPTSETEITGERAISKTILKNRGLVPHKAKINRNPRVKKRMQYRKALIKRKGAVREVRTNEGHKYDGEETGIKSKITRSRKLVS